MRSLVTTVSHFRIECRVCCVRAQPQKFSSAPSPLFHRGRSTDRVHPELADASARTAISLRFSALAGAFLVGVAGAKWITNEVDKRLLKEGIKVAAKKTFPTKQAELIVKGSPRPVLQGIKEACEDCVAES